MSELHCTDTITKIPNFHIYVSVSDLYIPTISPAVVANFPVVAGDNAFVNAFAVVLKIEHLRLLDY